MSLPEISKLRLQKTVANIEMKKAFKNFKDLCVEVAASNFAEEEGLDSETIGQLIIHHEIVTKTLKPGEVRVEQPKVENTKETTKSEPATVVKTVATFDEGGKGRKQCPSCSKYVAALARTCACGHAFVFKAKKVKAELDDDDGDDEVPEEVMPVKAVKKLSPASFIRRTHTPSGECPHRLTGTDKASVTEWGLKVRGTYAARGDFLLLHGLIYFVNQFYDRHREAKDYQTARENLESAFGNEYTSEMAETD